MPRITLLQMKTVEYGTVGGIDRLIKTHKDDLAVKIANLDDPKASAAFSAIAFNIVHLMRERDKFKRQKTKLLVLPGGKKD